VLALDIGRAAIEEVSDGDSLNVLENAVRAGATQTLAAMSAASFWAKSPTGMAPRS
jgi:hypothetical protein